MQNQPLGKITSLLVVVSALAFGLNVPLQANTQIEAVNDGAGITAYANSSKVVLSMNIRVTGPNNFVFEDRIENDVINWTPEGELADGLYHWEVWTVTAEHSVPMREISIPRQASHVVQSGETTSAPQPSNHAGIDLDEIPLERFFAPHEKNIGSSRLCVG